MTQPARTSQSHPLQIGSVPCSLGRIGITFCPGKKGPSLKGAPWDRDLDLDLKAIGAFGATSLVSLIEDFEFDLLQVPKAQFAARARELFTWYHLPIVDVSIPMRPSNRPGRRHPWRFVRSWSGEAPWSFTAAGGWDEQA